MSLLFEAGREVSAFCSERGWKFCLIGGVALQRWGEPRFTRDVDLTIVTGFGGEGTVIHQVLSHFESRVSGAAAFAMQSRVLLVKTSSGIPIDISLGGLPFEERMIERSTVWDPSENLALRTCSAEDLIVLKAFAGRPQDWVDIERVAVRQAGKLAEALILEELSPLLELKDDTASAERLRGILAAAASV